jgi:transposase-like protein
LKKDRESLMAFYDFPAEHWLHLRTTNAIESTFALVKSRAYAIRSSDLHRSPRSHISAKRKSTIGLGYEV